MINIRFKGLWQLHGFIIMMVMPLLFTMYAHLSYRFFDKFNYVWVNYPLYWFGAFLSGFISLMYYPRLEATVGKVTFQKLIHVTNRQILSLLVIMFTLVFATKDQAMSRVFMVSFIVMSWFVLLFMNWWVPELLSKVAFGGSNLRVCALVGSGQLCLELQDWLLAHNTLGLNIVGYLGESYQQCALDGKDLKFDHLGQEGSLDTVIQQKGINQIILLETKNSKAWVQQILHVCEKNACRVLIYDPWRQFFDKPMIVIQEGIHTFFTFKDEPLENPANRLIKRILDLCIAIPVVIGILPVLAIVVKIAQLIESPGPLFFVQERIGFNRKPFRIYKFRSMFYESNKVESLQASKEDKRIFHFGKIMRRTSIDEFPQFLNVLLGNMSIVGPRPHYIGHDKLFTEYIGTYKQRHFAKPGITGLAQIKGYRGELTDLQLLRKRTHYDLEYIDNWSWTLDMTIILRTLWQVLFPPKTAY